MSITQVSLINLLPTHVVWIASVARDIDHKVQHHYGLLPQPTEVRQYVGIARRLLNHERSLQLHPPCHEQQVLVKRFLTPSQCCKETNKNITVLYACFHRRPWFAKITTAYNFEHFRYSVTGDLLVAIS